MSRQTIILLISLVVAAVVSLIFVVLALGHRAAMKEVDQKLLFAKGRLDKLYAADPFPSDENRETERRNLETRRGQLRKLMGRLAEDQLDPQDSLSRADFMKQLNKGRVDLIGKAAASGTDIPEDFAFGFDVYVRGGTAPNLNDVPWLAQQLAVVDRFCRKLLAAKVDALISVNREQIEGRHMSATTPGAGDAAAGSAPDRPLYDATDYTFTFRAFEKSIGGILTSIAEDPMFTVVTAVRMDKRGTGVHLPEEKKQGDARTPEDIVRDILKGSVPDSPKPEKERGLTLEEQAERDKAMARDRRVVSGMEEVAEIEISVQVFWFHEATP